MDSNKPRQGAKWQFRNTVGPPFIGRHDFRGAFHGPRPMPTYPHQGSPYRDQFNPKYNHSHDYRRRFFSPPREGQSLHHENRYGEFTPPRPFYGSHRGGRQSSNKGIGQWEYQRPAPETKNSNARFSSHKYFKESMLDDPWKELTERKKAEQITKDSLSKEI